MTHDPDHDLRATRPDLSTTSGLSDSRAEEAYRRARQGHDPLRQGHDPLGQERDPLEEPWELRGTAHPRPSSRTRPGLSSTTRLIIVLLVVSLIVALVWRW